MTNRDSEDAQAFKWVTREAAEERLTAGLHECCDSRPQDAHTPDCPARLENQV